MKSKIKFEVNQSTEKVNFLDVTIILKDGQLTTTIYSKPTDSHLYLNVTSCHPVHVIKNIPKGQLLRLRRICSNTADFIQQCNIYISYFVNRGYNKMKLEQLAKDILKINREELLVNREKTDRDTQTILTCTWHPKLRTLPQILRQHYYILENDKSLSKIFYNKPMVSFRKKKSIRNYVTKSDITPPQINLFNPTLPCGKCESTCHLINQSSKITNSTNNKTITITSGGNCKTKNIIYAARCKKHDLIYIGHTGRELSNRFSKHRYDAKKRPDNCELAKHIHKHRHNFEKDIDIVILQDQAKSVAERELLEDKFICRLGTRTPNGLNTDLHNYGTEMYDLYQEITKSMH